MIIGIRLNDHEPNDFEYFGYQENKFSADYYAPALRIGDAVSVHKTSDPDYESDHRKLPEINEWDREIFEAVQNLKDGAFRAILKKLKGGGLILDEGDLDEKESQGTEA